MRPNPTSTDSVLPHFSAHRISALAELFAQKCADEKGVEFRPLSSEAAAVLLSYDWNGDLSAMEATIRRAVVMADGNEISAEALRLPAPSLDDGMSHSHGTNAQTALRPLLGITVSEIERDLVLLTLKYCRGSRTRAASVLGMSVRTLRNKLKRYSADGATVPGSFDRKEVRQSRETHARAVPRRPML